MKLNEKFKFVKENRKKGLILLYKRCCGLLSSV